MKPIPRTVLIPVLLAATVWAGCASSVNPISGRKSYGFTWTPAEEVRIGQESDAAIVAQYGLYDDPELTAYVERLGQELVQVSHFRRGGVDPVWANLEFHFRVLDSPVVNAFALPGGKMGVYTGMLKVAENQDQLASVLGHEVGHVLAQHANERMSQQQLTSVGLAVAAGSGYLDSASMQALGLGAQIGILLPYSRTHESEADIIGLDLMTTYSSFPTTSLKLLAIIGPTAKMIRPT